MKPLAGRLAEGIPLVVGLMLVCTKSSEPSRRALTLMRGVKSYRKKPCPPVDLARSLPSIPFMRFKCSKPPEYFKRSPSKPPLTPARPRNSPKLPPSNCSSPRASPPPCGVTTFTAPPTALVPYRDEPDPRSTSTRSALTKFNDEMNELASACSVVVSRNRNPSMRIAEASARKPRIRNVVSWPMPPRLRAWMPGEYRTTSPSETAFRFRISSLSTTLTALDVSCSTWAAPDEVTSTVWFTPATSSSTCNAAMPGVNCTTRLSRRNWCFSISSTNSPAARRPKANPPFASVATRQVSDCCNNRTVASTTAPPCGSITRPVNAPVCANTTEPINNVKT